MRLSYETKSRIYTVSINHVSSIETRGASSIFVRVRSKAPPTDRKRETCRSRHGRVEELRIRSGSRGTHGLRRSGALVGYQRGDSRRIHSWGSNGGVTNVLVGAVARAQAAAMRLLSFFSFFAGIATDTSPRARCHYVGWHVIRQYDACRRGGAVYAHPSKELRARVVAIARILGSVVEQTGLVGRWPVWQGCVQPYPFLMPLPPPDATLLSPRTPPPATSLSAHSAVTFACSRGISRFFFSFSSYLCSRKRY